MIGIDEQPVPQEPRQATAATQPYPRGDSFVPQSIAIAPEGFTLVNGGKIFTPFWTEQPVPIKPAFSGGANWPPSSYDPATGYFYVCAQDRIGVFHTEDADPEHETGKRFVAGLFGSSSVPRLGVFAALDMHTNTIVWQQQWSEECYSGSTTTAGGLTFVGRNDGRLTALDSRNGTKLWEFQTGRRHERAGHGVRASPASSMSSRTRPAICSRLRPGATACGCSRWTARSSRPRRPAQPCC